MSSVHPSYEIKKLGSAQEQHTPYGGLTKREYFALEFAKSMISSGTQYWKAVDQGFAAADIFIQQS